jgi:alpha-galactosidase
MAMLCQATYMGTPLKKIVGLCHSVQNTTEELAELVGVPIEEVTFTGAGVNHQAFILRFERDGEDLYPRLDERLERDPELLRRVRVEMYRRLGYFPTESSEHSSEYLSWFLRSNEQIERFRLQPLEYLGISEDNVAEFHDAEAALASGRDLELEEGAAEYAPQIIHSMLTGTERVIHANVVNRGLIDNLPEGAVVEVPSTVDRDGVHPQPFGAIPTQGAALNRTYLSVAELTVEAARTGDARMVRQAVLVDPNAGSTLTPEQIWALCDELTEAHAAVLPVSLGGRTELVLP